MFGLPDEFTPGFLARLEKLRIRTRQRYAGLGRGMHLSPKRGSSLEFNDYRHYSPGDDFRYIDWGLYGRTDKLYIKLFQEEEDLLTYIFVDASASMAYPARDHKFEAAMVTALALAGSWWAAAVFIIIERTAAGAEHVRFLFRRRIGEGLHDGRRRRRDNFGNLDGGLRSGGFHFRLRRFFERRGDHGDQRIGRDERFLQNSIGANAPGFLLIQWIECAYQQNYRSLRKARILFDVFAYFVPIAHRHKNIRQHHIRIQIGHAAHGGFAIADGNHINSVFRERQRNHLLDVAVVVGDQNPGHLFPLEARRGSTHPPLS